MTRPSGCTPPLAPNWRRSSRPRRTGDDRGRAELRDLRLHLPVRRRDRADSVLAWRLTHTNYDSKHFEQKNIILRPANQLSHRQHLCVTNWRSWRSATFKNVTSQIETTETRLESGYPPCSTDRVQAIRKGIQSVLQTRDYAISSGMGRPDARMGIGRPSASMNSCCGSIPRCW